MERDDADFNVKEVLHAFGFDPNTVSCRAFGNGHINDTFLVSIEEKETNKDYIIQKINDNVFKKPEEVLFNMHRVTSFLSKKLTEEGGNPERETLSLINTTDGNYFYKDSSGGYWRTCPFINNSKSLETPDSAEDMYNCGITFGNFQNLLSDFPASSLYETIPKFHHMPNRFQNFTNAVKKDIKQRKQEVLPEIQYFNSIQKEFCFCQKCFDEEMFPLRVTHNDTKLNNILFDKVTGKGLCVIDLDTVMPGFSMYDFGDAIRTGANTSNEDETDLSKVDINIEYYKAFAKGFIESCGKNLTRKELELLPYGAFTMTIETGIRFLTDYLEGDTYYKIKYEKHNLDRARCQIKLAQKMQEHKEEMIKIVSEMI